MSNEEIQDVNEEVELDEEGQAVAPKAPPAPAKIIRGRMPLPLVWHVRFVASATTETIDEETEEVTEGYASDSAVAKDMLTTAGKIMDIRTNRNFKYLTENTTFSQADIDEAKAQLSKNIAEGKKRGADEPSHDYSEDEASSLFAILDAMVSEASTVADDRAAFNEANPRVKKEKAEGVEAVEEAVAEEDAMTEEEVDEELEDLMS